MFHLQWRPFLLSHSKLTILSCTLIPMTDDHPDLPGGRVGGCYFARFAGVISRENSAGQSTML